MDAFDSDGTATAVQAAIYTAIPDISGDPNLAVLESRLENATYHVTEEGKAGFYVNPDTGHVVGVFDRPTDPTTEPPIESRGILNTFPVPEHFAPDLTPGAIDTMDVPAPLHELPAYNHIFDDKPDDAWSGAGPFAAGTAASD